MVTSPKINNNTDLTLSLANDLVSIGSNPLSPEDVSQIETLVIDHFGVCLRGGVLPWSQSLQTWGKRRSPDKGLSAVFGSGYSSTAAIAALINATAAHGMELDDTHDSSVSHPGAVVIAVAFALGAERIADSKQILSAIAVGYETIGRIGRATGAGQIIEHGFHPTALFGGFAAVSTAASLMKFDAETLTRAWGLMLSMSGGSMQFSEDPRGTTVKRLHAGYGAHNGILAAEFAELSIDGPSRAFDGRYGLCNIFGKQTNIEELIKDSDEQLEIHKISLKPYPCCRLFHSTIDALRNVTDNFSLNPKKIESILVGGPSIMESQHMMKRPTSVMAAQYSLPFTIGSSIINGPTVYDGFEKNNLTNKNVLELADKVTAVGDVDLDSVFPDHFGSWVEVLTADGKRLREDVLDSYGTPQNPMDDNAMRDKVDGLLVPLKGTFSTDELISQIKMFFKLESSEVSNFTKKFIPIITLK